MNDGGIGATVSLLVILFPIIGFILIFGELMVIRKHQKRMMELLRKVFPRETAEIDREHDDDAS